MDKNYIFRKFKCNLTTVQASELCFKSVRTINLWDSGKAIPPECKRLMRIYSNRGLGLSSEWTGFRLYKEKMLLPTGQLVTPQEILAGIALLKINSDLELRGSTLLLQTARALALASMK